MVLGCTHYPLLKPAIRRLYPDSFAIVDSAQTTAAKVEKLLDHARMRALGASRWQTFFRVVLPVILPAALAGFAMAFARAVGEYGSVVFISGNMPMRTEITPLLIITKLDQYDYDGATAIAVVMLVFSLAQGLFWAGAVSTFIMGIGTAITVALIATIAVAAKAWAKRCPVARRGSHDKIK